MSRGKIPTTLESLFLTQIVVPRTLKKRPRLLKISVDKVVLNLLVWIP